MTPLPAASSSATPGRTGSGNSVAPTTQPTYRMKSARMATTKAGWPLRAARHATSAASSAAAG